MVVLLCRLEAFSVSKFLIGILIGGPGRLIGMVRRHVSSKYVSRIFSSLGLLAKLVIELSISRLIIRPIYKWRSSRFIR
jgi:hypothetical protein